MLARLEDAGGAEEHGDMRVVPARVHLPGDPALVLPLHRLLQQPHTRTARTRRQASEIFHAEAEPGRNGQLDAPTFQSVLPLLCQTRMSGQPAIVRKRPRRPRAFGRKR